MWECRGIDAGGTNTGLVINDGLQFLDIRKPPIGITGRRL